MVLGVVVSLINEIIDYSLTYRRSSSWLWAKAWATRSNRIDLAVSGDAAPPELESHNDMPWSSSRDISDDSAGRLSCLMEYKKESCRLNNDSTAMVCKSFVVNVSVVWLFIATKKICLNFYFLAYHFDERTINVETNHSHSVWAVTFVWLAILQSTSLHNLTPPFA